MGNFIAGRFINGENGFDPLYGAAYYLQVADPTTLQPYSTWQQLFTATYGADPAPQTELGGHPDVANGYAAFAKAALASVVTGTESPDAIEGYGFVVGH